LRLRRAISQSLAAMATDSLQSRLTVPGCGEASVAQIDEARHDDDGGNVPRASDHGTPRRELAAELCLGDVESQPREAGGWFDLAVAFEKQGDLEAAEAAYRRADEMGLAAAACNLGVLLEHQNDRQAAEAAYRRADGRGDAIGTFNLGLLLEEDEELAGAESAYRRADARGHAAAASNLGVLLADKGDIAGAEAAFRRAAQRGYADATFNLRVLLEEQAAPDGEEQENPESHQDGADAEPNCPVLLKPDANGRMSNLTCDPASSDNRAGAGKEMAHDGGAPPQDRPPAPSITDDRSDMADGALSDRTGPEDGAAEDRLPSVAQAEPLVGAGSNHPARPDRARGIFRAIRDRAGRAARGATNAGVATRVMARKSALLAAGLSIVAAGLAIAALTQHSPHHPRRLESVRSTQTNQVAATTTAATPARPAARMKRTLEHRSPGRREAPVHKAPKPRPQAHPKPPATQGFIAKATPRVHSADTKASGSGSNVSSSGHQVATRNAGSSGGGYHESGSTYQGSGVGSPSDGGGSSSAGGRGGGSTSSSSGGGGSSGPSSSGGSSGPSVASSGGSGSAGGTTTIVGGG
jgi:tetratricopeptide (TPR) repeat protein